MVQPAFPGRGAGAGPGRLGGSGPRLPGSVPRVWNIPARNLEFTGRDQMLVALRDVLTGGDRAVVQALHGLGGVGKTQLAAEYAWRFTGAYELGWWVDAEQAGLIGDQFAALGAALRCVEPGARTEEVRAAVLGELRDRGRWLLVFDNAQAPGDLAGWLPGGGHVLITSRQHRWGQVAAPVEVDVLARAESVALLAGRVSGLAEADAGRLADALGDLPLALAQAAEYLAETGMGAAEYLALLRTRTREILDQGRPVSYPMIAGRRDRPGRRPARPRRSGRRRTGRAVRVPGPEPVPVDLFTGATAELPAGLAARAADPIAWRQTLTQVSRHALARLDHRGLQMHRLIQAILRDRLTPEQAAATRQRAEAILVANNPRRPGQSGHLAPVGAADAPPAGRRPRRHHQPQPALAGLQRELVPARPRRYPQQLRPRREPAPAMARASGRQRGNRAGDRSSAWPGRSRPGPLRRGPGPGAGGRSPRPPGAG